MTRYLLHQKRTVCFLLNILVLLILVIFIFLYQPVNAQWIQPFSTYGFQTMPTYLQFPWFSPSPFFTPLSNPFALGTGPRPILPTAPPLVSLAGFPTPTASIAGVTTIFVPLSATTDIKILIKPPEVDTIKLEELVAPYTVYVWPEGYEPPISEAARILATVSGGFLPFFHPF